MNKYTMMNDAQSGYKRSNRLLFRKMLEYLFPAMLTMAALSLNDCAAMERCYFLRRLSQIEGATVISEAELHDAYDNYEQSILIPESTYCNLPCGMEGMGILLRISGLWMESPRADVKGVHSRFFYYI